MKICLQFKIWEVPRTKGPDPLKLGFMHTEKDCRSQANDLLSGITSERRAAQLMGFYPPHALVMQEAVKASLSGRKHDLGI